MKTKLNKLLYLAVFSCFSANIYSDITVIGTGKASASPNMVSFSINIETSAKTAAKAAQANAEQSDKTLTLLKKLVPEDKALATINYSLYPEYKYNRETNKSEFIGFKANNTIKVNSKNVANIGDILDQTIQSGITRVDNLQFGYDNPEELYQKALADAVANAKQRAEIIANSSDLKIKEIDDVSVILDNGFSNPDPMPRMMMAESAIATPIEASDVNTQARVKVVFDT